MSESQGVAPRSQVGQRGLYQRTQPWLGTLVSVGIQGVSAALAEGAMARAFQSVRRVHRLMSFHEPDSDVTRINRAEPGVAVSIEPETYTVLSMAQQIAQDSAGRRQVAFQPQVRHHGGHTFGSSGASTDPVSEGRASGGRELAGS